MALTLFWSALCSDKRQPLSHGSCDSDDALPFNSRETWHSGSWDASQKDGTQYNTESFYAQDEPLNFCLSSGNVHKAQTPHSTWDERCLSASYAPPSTAGYYSSKMGKHLYSGKFRFSPGCPQSKQYGHANKDGYYGSGKNQSEYMAHDNCYNGGLILPETAIKTEQDSDSENGVYGGVGQQNNIWRYNMTYPDAQQIKTETDYDDHYGVSQPINGHKYLYTGASKPLKCVLNKDMPHSDHGANCHPYLSNSAEPRAVMQPEYKLSYELRNHSLLHAIKREPVESMLWTDCGHDHPQEQMDRNGANCAINTTVHKNNAYLYMQ